MNTSVFVHGSDGLRPGALWIGKHAGSETGAPNIS
jgi:hypothetical protein